MRAKDWVGAGCLAAAAIYAFAVIPAQGQMTSMINGTIYASYGVLTLSLALIWGYAGILSFGQSAFFGLGAYAYAVFAINFNATWEAACVAIAVPALFAALLGYFMFWGRLSDVYLGVITLTVSLILYRFLNQTAGDEWTIGTAALGGFNGIPSTPPLTIPFDPDDPLTPQQIYLVAMGALAAIYAICRLIAVSHFGRVLAAIRQNELRAELLGYNTRLYKLAAFIIGGAIAGAAGVLFANCVFVSPNMFNLQTNGQLIIWVIIGGLGTLAGPVIGCVLMLMLSTTLGTVNQGGAHFLDPNLIIGLVLTAAVLGMRKGLLPLLTTLFDRAMQLRPALPAEAVGEEG